MNDSEFVDVGATRLLQQSSWARDGNWQQLVYWGPYNLLKATPPGDVLPNVSGYITLLPTLADKTPRQMERLLGLKLDALANGAFIYRLTALPAKDAFEPRGYSTLVDGKHLGPGLKADRAGYRVGQGAWQVVLTAEVPAVLIARLGPDQPFDPGLHPSVAASLRGSK